MFLVFAKPVVAQPPQAQGTADAAAAPMPNTKDPAGITNLETVAESSSKKWFVDLTLYALASGMTGDVAAGPVNADVDVDFVDVLENLEFAGMGKIRVGYEKWALTTDVLYVGLGNSNDIIVANLDQWLVEPTVSYRVNPYFEPLAGFRYNRLSADVTGPLGRQPSNTQEWFDPIVGTNLTLPVSKTVDLNFRGDVGGFGVGSDLTWQVFPHVSWRFHRHFSVDAGYRLLYTDYSNDEPRKRFNYEVLTHGPQVGFTAHF